MARYRVSSFFSLALLALAAPAVAIPATNPSTEPTLQDLKRQEYLQQMKDKAELPLNDATNLSDVVHVNLRAGRIVVDTPMKPGDWVRLPLSSNAVICTMHVPSRQFLQLTLDNFTDSDDVYMQADVYSAPGQVQIVGSWEFGDRERFVTLMEKYPSVDEDGTAVPGETSLRVQETSDSGDQKINLYFQSPDLASLIRDHPDEMRTYARPVLQQIQAEAILSPDPHVEWQIFGPQATPEPNSVAAVQKLLPLLDSESFSQRQNTVAQLANLKTSGAIALMHIDPGTLSPEQQARIQEVLKPYRQLSTEQAVKLSQQPEFLLDCLSSDDPQLRRLAARQLAAVVKHPIVFDPDAPPALRQSQLARIINETQMNTDEHR